MHGNSHDAGVPILYHLAGRTGCAAFFSIAGCMKAVPQTTIFTACPDRYSTYTDRSVSELL